MNKSYIYDNDKVIVIDDKGNDKKIDNNDKINDILVSENVIETLNSKKIKIKEILLKLKDIEKPNKKVFIIDTIKSILTYEFVFLLTFLLLTIWELEGEYLSFELASYIIMASMVIVPIIDIRKHLLNYKKEKQDYQEKVLYKMQYSSINKLLDRERKNLKSLQNNNKIQTKLDKIKVQKVNDLPRLKELRSIFQEMKEISIYSDILSKFYKRGTLENKMHEIHEPLIIELTEKYFDDINNKKIKKKKN